MRRAYSLPEAAALLGLSPDHIQALSRRLLGAPRDLFTFQEVVLMRTNAARRPARELRWGDSPLEQGASPE